MLSEKTADVTFVVGQKRFVCHRALLGSCSVTLRQLMKAKAAEPGCEIALKGISASVFHCVLQILYGDHVVVRVLMLPKLLRAGVRLKCGKVVEACKAFVSSCMTPPHACFLLDSTLQIAGGESVRSEVERFVAIYAQQVIHTKGFINLSLDAMICLLRLALVVRPLDLIVACLAWAVAEAERRGEPWRVVMQHIAPLLPLQSIEIKDVVQHILPLGILSAGDALDLMTLLSGLPPVERPLSPFSPPSSLCSPSSPSSSSTSASTIATSPWGVRVMSGVFATCEDPHLFCLQPRNSNVVRLAGDRSFALIGPSSRSEPSLQAWQADVLRNMAGGASASADEAKGKEKETKQAWRVEMLAFDPQLHRVDIGITKSNSASPPAPLTQPSDGCLVSSTGDVYWRSNQPTPISFAIKQGAIIDCMLDLQKGTLSMSSSPGHSTFSSETQRLNPLPVHLKEHFVPYAVMRNLRPTAPGAASHPPCRLKIYPIPGEFYGQ